MALTAVLLSGCGESGPADTSQPVAQGAEVTAAFPADLAPLQEGAEVRAGGQPVGRVLSVQEEGEGVVSATLDVDADLYTDGQPVAGVIGPGGTTASYVQIALPPPGQAPDPSAVP